MYFLVFVVDDDVQSEQTATEYERHCDVSAPRYGSNTIA